MNIYQSPTQPRKAVNNMNSEVVEITKIPFPSHLLKGEWYGTVYGICTEGTSAERHNEIVEEKIKESAGIVAEKVGMRQLFEKLV